MSLSGDQLAPYRIQESFTPLGIDAQRQYGNQFRQITDIVMNEINSLLDPEYQFDPEATQSVDNSKKFI